MNDTLRNKQGYLISPFFDMIYKGLQKTFILLCSSEAILKKYFSNNKVVFKFTFSPLFSYSPLHRFSNVVMSLRIKK